MKNIPELFGSKVFNDSVMRSRLPKNVYKALKRTMTEGKHLELDVANVVASAMNEIIMEFSGKELVRGEPDASSFPSGGLRATFEARGYTVWDTTSYAFIKDDSLCIPTAFCSYSGESLDKKTPLLRSMEAIDKQAMRVLKLFGNTKAMRVVTTVGPEQEYFLIDKNLYEKRPDLVTCGRTLFGARPPKGQELDDHYFGSLKPRVSAYMKDLEQELWSLGILAKTKHNEVAPAQHELAPVFTTTNIATDHNQLTMELMKSVATKHNLVCVLHEKPFAGVNGSGKHNNWSLSTDYGSNLLEPGDTPSENARFLLFLAAVIKAVDEYQDLLRVCVASAGNDHRLGANEAPPAILSMFLGDELTDIIEAIINESDYTDREKTHMQIGATVLPHFPKDTTDRNRTSPFAFTGNKFEFRMLGSTFSIAGPNIVLNTAVAEVLSGFADRLEKESDFNSGLEKLIKETVSNHFRIVFNGNNYSDEWVKEAEKRGLLNLQTTVDALPTFVADKNVKLFVKHGVFSKTEVESRYEILLEGYCKTINIEALTMIDMVRKDIIGSSFSYQQDILQLLKDKKSAGISTKLEEKLITKLSNLTDCLVDKVEKLESDVINAGIIEDSLEQARYYRSNVFSTMNRLRLVADELEMLTLNKHSCYPSYAELLYSVN